MIKTTIYTRFLIIFAIILTIFEESNGYKLRTVNAIFRHGDRTPEELYPNDPHSLKEFYPTPLGGLINAGKNREYELGRFLRKTYNELLGDLYIPSDIYARCTGYDRTQMSLLLVLAGLYPPKNVQRWHSNLNWQPIPIISVDKHKDFLLHPSPCPTWTIEMKKVKQTEDYKKDVAKFQDLMDKMTKYTGAEITGTDKVMDIFHTLTSEQALNMTIPDWANQYFPKGLLTDATIFQYKTANYNDKLKKLNGGTFLRKILDDMKAVKQGESRPKIFLYSAHEMTVAAGLFALNVWKPEVPEYSSAAIVELWEKDSQFFVKILYYKGIPPISEVRTIPNCAEYCPLNQFEKLMHNVLPQDYEKECQGNSDNN